jgi:hypothetical protein
MGEEFVANQLRARISIGVDLFLVLVMTLIAIAAFNTQSENI